MKKLFIAALAAALLLCSCGKADVVIRTDLENTRGSAYAQMTEATPETAATDEAGNLLYIVNLSSKTFHLNENCRFVKAMSDKNRAVEAASGVEEMVERGYSPCSNCIGKLENNTDI